MHNIIKTLAQLKAVQADAWVYGVIVCAVALGLAILVANLIPWASHRKCYITRRIWFVLIGLIMQLCYWLYNVQYVLPRIQNAGFQTMYKETNLYVLLVFVAAYFAVGIGLMFCFRHSKFGSILGKVR